MFLQWSAGHRLVVALSGVCFVLGQLKLSSGKGFLVVLLSKVALSVRAR